MAELEDFINKPSKKPKLLVDLLKIGEASVNVPRAVADNGTTALPLGSVFIPRYVALSISLWLSLAW